MNQEERKTTHNQALIITFVLWQPITWDIIKGIMPQSDYSYLYPAFQLFFTFAYSVFCVFFTGYKQILEESLGKNPKVNKAIDLIISGSEFILAWILGLAEVVSLACSQGNRSREVKLIRSDISEKIKKNKQEPLQVRCVSVVGFITVISLILCFIFRDEFIDWYSKVMNSIASGIGLIFVLQETKKNDVRKDRVM